jgi:hypothetical protein
VPGASRPQFDRALEALIEGDTLVITTLDRLGRSTQNMLASADELRSRGAGLLVLNLGGDTATPMGSMQFTIMDALAQMEHEIKRERATDSIGKRREAGKDLGGRPARSQTARSEAPSASSKAENLPRKSPTTLECHATFYSRSRSLADGGRFRLACIGQLVTRVRHCILTGKRTARLPETRGPKQLPHSLSRVGGTAYESG